MPAHLTVKSGKLAGRKILIAEDEPRTLGRSEHSDISFDDQLLSRIHCEIAFKDGRYFIRDLESSNGTFVDSIQVEEHELDDGCEIRIGETFLQFSILRTDDFKGRVLKHYRIVEKIAAGRMGSVYKAIDERDGCTVAIKIMRPGMVENGVVLKRFLREANLGASIVHENLIAVREGGEEDGIHFIAMEYVNGRTVESILQESGAFDVASALIIVAQVARALKYALEKAAIVHRDVKPANILVTADGVAKLADLGLAKSRGALEKTQLTKTGRGLGTATFMAPEQMFDAAHTDHRADIYALGATLYAMITGRPPYEATTLKELIAKIDAEDIRPPQVFNPSIPRSIWHLIRRMMCKDRARRYDSYEQLLAVIERIRTSV